MDRTLTQKSTEWGFLFFEGPEEQINASEPIEDIEFITYSDTDSVNVAKKAAPT